MSTKYGMIRTDHILFIASGAFHPSKPSDLIPELQGRFPIRVELESLSVSDFEAILTQTDASLTKQYQALLATEEVNPVFAPDGIRRLAEIAFSVNEKVENIGARRLYTVMERLLEDLSFHAAKSSGETITVDAAYVDARWATWSATRTCRVTCSERTRHRGPGRLPRPTRPQQKHRKVLFVPRPWFLTLDLGLASRLPCGNRPTRLRRGTPAVTSARSKLVLAGRT